MEFEVWLNRIADFLVNAGVPAEHGPMAALALIYLGLTLLALLIVIALLRRNLRSAKTEAKTDTQTAPAGQAEAEPRHEEPLAADLDEELIVKEPLPVDEEQVVDEPVNLFQRMRAGLNKTRSSLLGRVDALLGTHPRLDEEFLEELEEILITADFGMQATQELVQALTARLKDVEWNDPGQLREILAEEIRVRLKDAEPGWPAPENAPLVIMVVGVNGVGKTTTIGKLAKQFADQDKKVVLGAGDTFRAAAAEQLEVWGTRSGSDVIRHQEGADPGAVVYDAVKAAVARKADVLILDTAGRLHTKVNLMEELKKVRRIIDREIPGAPHETLLVLDATTGQNALIQAKMFQEAVEVSGIALTKLDGTAKGGIVVAISSQLDLPVRLIGVGEGVADLRPFNADEFVEALFANN
jgi:fused signal recognition particle receptor